MALPRSFQEAAARLGGLVSLTPPGRVSDIPLSGVRAKRDLSGIVGQGRYQIDAPIGAGATGIVYGAWHTQLQKPVALKVLRREYCGDEELVLRFLNEARTASAIESEHVVRVLDCGRLDDGSPYFVMELLDGISLAELVEAHAGIPMSLAVEVAIQVAEGLEAAHALHVVHRDLKPENIMLCPRPDGQWLAKIVDFGIAKALGSGDELTRVGHIFGTPHYMSPEQTLGTAVDNRSDIYALGVMLYEMLSGRQPVAGRRIDEVLADQRSAPLPPLRSQPLARNVPPRLEAIVHCCLEKDPERRYANVEALLKDLKHFANRAGRAGEEEASEHTVIDLPSFTPPSVRSLKAAALRIVPQGAPAARVARHAPTVMLREYRLAKRTVVACTLGAVVGLGVAMALNATWANRANPVRSVGFPLRTAASKGSARYECLTAKWPGSVPIQAETR